MRSPAPRGARGSWLTNEDIPRSLQDFADCRLIFEFAVQHHVGELEAHVQFDRRRDLGNEAHVSELGTEKRLLVNAAQEGEARAKTVATGRHVSFEEESL